MFLFICIYCRILKIRLCPWIKKSFFLLLAFQTGSIAPMLIIFEIFGERNQIQRSSEQHHKLWLLTLVTIHFEIGIIINIYQNPHAPLAIDFFKKQNFGLNRFENFVFHFGFIPFINFHCSYHGFFVVDKLDIMYYFEASSRTYKSKQE